MKPRAISLALQGGGAHGAYTWGVLDALLEDGRFTPLAVSGASAGAMNAAVMLTGWIEDGADGARRNLATFWRAVASANPREVVAGSPWQALFGGLAGDMLTAFAEAVTRVSSPYELNPLNLNPLRDIAAAHVNCDAIRTSRHQIFVSATPVRTGGLRIFTKHDLSIDALLASACLPTVFHAVEIDGAPYWDGGYSANPPLAPLVNAPAPAPDVIVVHINPMHRSTPPRSADDIVHRLNEVTFNAPLLGELRAIRHTRTHTKPAGLASWFQSSAPKPRLHAISADEALGSLSAKTKMETSWAFLQELQARGREAARHWIAAQANHVGRRETMMLAALLDAADSGQ